MTALSRAAGCLARQFVNEVLRLPREKMAFRCRGHLLVRKSRDVSTGRRTRYLYTQLSHRQDTISRNLLDNLGRLRDELLNSRYGNSCSNDGLRFRLFDWSAYLFVFSPIIVRTVACRNVHLRNIRDTRYMKAERRSLYRRNHSSSLRRFLRFLPPF